MARLFPVGNEGQAFPEMGEEQRAPIIRVLTLDLSVARTKIPIEIGGNFIWAATASDNSATVDLSFARETADDGFPFKSGVRLSGLPFSRLFATNLAQAGKTITFVYAVERAGRGLEIDNAAGDFSSVTLVKPSASLQVADATIAINTTAIALAVQTGRTRAWIEADINNTEDLRVGTTVADATGLLLTPGAAVEIFTTEQINIRNASTNTLTQTWRAFEEIAP